MDDVTPARWAWVPDYEGLYRVSDRGDAWSEPRATTRGGLLKFTLSTTGYCWVTLTKDGEQARFAVHRLVLTAFAGPCPEGQEARHLDGNCLNNRWAPGNEKETVAAGGNLIWGTHSENIRDKHRHGTTWQLNVTECPQGHEYTPENTMINKKGSRVCLICKRERGLEQYYAKKATGKQVWVPSADLPPDELEKRRARGREQQRRRQAEGLIPKYSELSPEQQEHVRELARERKRRYRERKRQQQDG